MSWGYSDLVTEVYEFDLPLGHTVGDVEYYLRALDGIDGRIYEPACGTGRMLIPLAEAGHRVEGGDHSPEMIDICRRNFEDRSLSGEFHVADMARFVRPGRYEAIIVPAGSIRNLDGRAATLQALNCFHESLVSGGTLLLDLIAPRSSIAPGPMQYWSKDPYLLTRQMVHVEYDPLANRETEFLRYEKWRDGNLVTTELHRFCMQHWGLEEFKALLVAVGFEVLSIDGDFREGVAPSSRTADWTFRARRT